MSSGGDLFFAFILILFVGTVAFTIYTISKHIGTNDNKTEVTDALKTIVITNTVLVLLMGFIAYIYIQNRPIVRPTYTMIMLHANFLLSLTAVSIAALVQLSPA
jgi:hypothetical protein